MHEQTLPTFTNNRQVTEKHPEKVDAIESFPERFCLFVGSYHGKVRKQCFHCTSTNIVMRLGPHN